MICPQSSKTLILPQGRILEKSFLQEKQMHPFYQMWELYRPKQCCDMQPNHCHQFSPQTSRENSLFSSPPPTSWIFATSAISKCSTCNWPLYYFSSILAGFTSLMTENIEMFNYFDDWRHQLSLYQLSSGSFKRYSIDATHSFMQ